MLRRGVKKGQITVFIIVGILMLLGVSLFYYIRQTSITQDLKEQVEGTFTEKVPTEMIPLKNNIELCISQNLERGLRLLEEHGGYITSDLDEKLDYVPYSPTESNALEFQFGSRDFIPYWYYLQSPNDCVSGCQFDSLMPPLCDNNKNCAIAGTESIQQKLEDYVKTELVPCLNDFRDYRDMGYSVDVLSAPETEIMIRDIDVLADVKMPIRITKDGITYTLERFQFSVPSNLKELYEVAYNLTQYEINKCYIEDHVKSYYTIFQGLDDSKNQLPPSSPRSTIGDFSMSIWVLNDVKNNIQSKTFTALSLLGVGYSIYNPVIIGDDVDMPEQRQAVYDQFVIYPFNETYHEVTINFWYYPFFWDTYFDIQPSEGGLIKPQTYSNSDSFGIISQITQGITIMRNYEYSYQYSFPVLIEIRKNIERRVEVFRFALEGNIRANTCFNSSMNLIYRVPVQGLACNQNQRDKAVNITVKDEKTFKPVKDAVVYFFSGQKCSLGMTNANGKIEAWYPESYGGYFIIKKDGYITKKVEALFTEPLILYLKPYVSINISVKKYTLNVFSNDLDNNGEYDNTFSMKSEPEPYLKKDETVFITVERRPDDLDPLNEFKNQAFVCDRKGCGSLNKLKLIEGTYDVKIESFTGETYTIYKNCQHICKSIGVAETEDSWDYEDHEAKSRCCDERCTIGDDCTCKYNLLGLKCCNIVNEWVPQKDMPMPEMGAAYLNADTEPWVLSQGEFDNINPSEVVEFRYIQLPKATCLGNTCVLNECVSMAEASIEAAEPLSNQYKYDLMPRILVP
jgi:hypothetical protein